MFLLLRERTERNGTDTCVASQTTIYPASFWSLSNTMKQRGCSLEGSVTMESASVGTVGGRDDTVAQREGGRSFDRKNVSSVCGRSDATKTIFKIEDKIFVTEYFCIAGDRR
jgi:hypothetical protein